MKKEKVYTRSAKYARHLNNKRKTIKFAINFLKVASITAVVILLILKLDGSI